MAKNKLMEKLYINVFGLGHRPHTLDSLVVNIETIKSELEKWFLDEDKYKVQIEVCLVPSLIIRSKHTRPIQVRVIAQNTKQKGIPEKIEFQNIFRKHLSTTKITFFQNEMEIPQVF